MDKELKKWFNSQFGILKTRILRFKVVGMDPKVAKKYYSDVGYFLDKNKEVREVPNGMYVERPIFNNTGIRVAIFNDKLANVKTATDFLKKCGLDAVLVDNKIRKNISVCGVSIQIG